MNTRRITARRLEEERMNEEIHPQVEQVKKVSQDGKGFQGFKVRPQGDHIPNVEGGNEVLMILPKFTNQEIREALMTLDQAVTTQINSMGEDPQEFLDGVYKVLSSMGVTFREKVELALYQLRDVNRIWYTQRKDNTSEESGPIELEEFNESFLGFKKRDQTQEEPKSAKVKLEKGGSSQKVKPTCAKCGKKHYGECLLGTGSCFGCGKEGNKVRDCPMIASTGREDKQVAPTVPKDVAPTKRCFYALQSRGDKSDESDDNVGNFSLSCGNMSFF
ncbi:hypothetical protein EJD97_017732 [Solanum chilense]|uniref:CCHC-type domain-containing protein n=1 Tax=Solanum chilense TaxID=4083 RepID=A0A6N2C6C3_SOLCI|nr:hypothetical protein EJD97_017732 [Solanum chilense]